MEHRFEADEWSRLTPDERVRRCHLMAAEAQQLSKSANGGMQTLYLGLARQWLDLADEIKRSETKRSGGS